MGVLQTSKYCRNCERRTLHARTTFSAGWGLFLSLITVGLFIPIWILIGILGAFKPWRCQQCGSGKML